MSAPAGPSARDRVEIILREVLRCPIDWTDPTTRFRSRPEWGSLQQVQILTRVHTEFGVGQRPGDIDLLTSPQRIVDAIEGRDPATEPSARTGVEVDFGLARTYMDTTRITRIDAAGPSLDYRGHDVVDLARRSTYAQVARLLIEGDLDEPGHAHLSHLSEGAFVARTSDGCWDRTHHDLIRRMAHLDLGSVAPDDETDLRRQGWRLLGAAIQIVSCSPSPLDLCSDTIAGVISRSTPEPAGDDVASSLDALMVLQADHGSSAAAVAVRTAVSAGAPLQHGILAGLAAFGGRRHGGAIADVVRLVEGISDIDHIGAEVRRRLDANDPVPGFGHRVYRTSDPRVDPIRRLLAAAEERRRTTWWSDRLSVIRAEHRHLESSGAVANVDFYAGPLLRVLGFTAGSLTSLFAVARIAGWVAHGIEQAAGRNLIRPQLLYVGEHLPRGDQ